MPQILPSQPTFAGQFGSGLGQSLAQLVENKVSQMHAQQNQQRLASTLQKSGYSPEQAELISALPQKDLLTALQSLAPSSAQLASQQLAQVQPESEQVPNIQQVLGQLKSQTPELSGMELLKQAQTQKLGEIGLGQKQAQAPGQFTPLNAQELFEQARLQGITLTPEQQQKINNKVAAINASEDLQKQLQSFISKQAGTKQSGQKQSLPEIAQALTPQPLFKKPLTEAEKIAKERLELKKEEISAKEQTRINKETKPVYDQILRSAKAAKDNDLRLDRMEQLINTGRLSYPLWASLIKSASKGILGFGVDMSSLLTPESQEFQKIQQDFLKNAKEVFGNRISNYEVEQYLKTVPDLTQSPEGKKRVIRDLRAFNKASESRYNAMKQIIKENGNKRPENLEEQIEDKISPFLDQLSNDFKKEFEGSYANQPNPSSVIRRVLEPIGKLTGQV